MWCHDWVTRVKLQSQWWFRWLLLCLGHLYCIHNFVASVLERKIPIDELIDVTHQNGTFNVAWWSPCQMSKGRVMAVCKSHQLGNLPQWRLCNCCCFCPFSSSIPWMHLDPHRVSCSAVHSYIYRRLIKIVYCFVSSRIIEAVITSILEKVVLQKRKEKRKIDIQRTVTSRLWVRCLKAVTAFTKKWQTFSLNASSRVFQTQAMAAYCNGHLTTNMLAYNLPDLQRRFIFPVITFRRTCQYLSGPGDTSLKCTPLLVGHLTTMDTFN